MFKICNRYNLHIMKRITKNKQSKTGNQITEVPRVTRSTNIDDTKIKLDLNEFRFKPSNKKCSAQNVKEEKLKITKKDKHECVSASEIDVSPIKIKEECLDYTLIKENKPDNTQIVSNELKFIQKGKREHVSVQDDSVAPTKIKKECLDDTLMIKENKLENKTGNSQKLEEETLNIKQESVPKQKICTPTKSKIENLDHTLVKENKLEIKQECIENENDKVNVKSKFPLHWEFTVSNLREMRKAHDAPVDSMGCDQCMDGSSNDIDKRYQALLSLMLSSQTKDQITHAAMQKLIKHGCNLTNILSTSDEKLGELIYPVGFWKSKVKFIKASSEMIRDSYGGDIPKTVKELCKLKGVGPKMAHLCMKTAWGEVTGIGVDTHVHRISNRLGWVKSKNPEETRKQLEDWLPNELWSEVNHLLVGFGQQVCQPLRPQCATCLNYMTCPVGSKQLNEKKIKIKK